MIVVFGAFFTALLLPAALVLNGLVMLRREGRSLGNLLSLLVGLALGLIAALPFLTIAITSGTAYRIIFIELAAACYTFYLGSMFACYLAYGWFCVHMPSKRPVDAVVVLGSGLVRGEVPPLLAARLKAGIKVYHAQRTLGNRVIMVPSGGQGGDEPRSEGAAMAEYLIAHGVPPEDVLAETKSRTTRENITFSIDLIKATRPQNSTTPPRLAIATNNYHTLRAALLSRQLGVQAITVGAPTAGYYLPSALIREFVALLVASRAWHIAVAAFGALLTGVMIVTWGY
ncbi:MAG: YdcF family protein [Propionibacteriaceae bacterium]|nr:YdcF family protein [Propionibacteriaceae bacterium]